MRLNYLLWLQDLMEENFRSSSDVVGLDVGVGAACIYPLLAAKYLGWNMIGTETNGESLASARSNVDANGLGDKIKLVQAEEDGDIFKCLEDVPDRISFTMCNPPFFDEMCNSEEAEKRRRGEETPRHPDPAGQSHEMHTKGGELALATKMIEESAATRQNRGAAMIYTCLLGRKASLVEIKQILTQKQKEMGGHEPT